MLGDTQLAGTVQLCKLQVMHAMQAEESFRHMRAEYDANLSVLVAATLPAQEFVLSTFAVQWQRAGNSMLGLVSIFPNEVGSWLCQLIISQGGDLVVV